MIGSGTLETVQKTSLGYAGGKPNPLNPPYQGDLALNSPLIRGARGVKNDERWVSCSVSLETVQETLARHALHVEYPTLNPLNPPYQGDLALQLPLIRGI